MQLAAQVSVLLRFINSSPLSQEARLSLLFIHPSVPHGAVVRTGDLLPGFCTGFRGSGVCAGTRGGVCAVFVVLLPAASAFAVLILVLVVKEVGQEHQQDYDGCGGQSQVSAGRVFDVAGEIAQVRYGEYGLADQVFVVHRGCVGIFVGIALCVKMLIRVVYFYYSVRCDGEIFIENEGYRVAYPDVLRVGFLDVYQGSCVVGGFHGAGEHAVGLEADEFGSCQECCCDDYYRHQDCCYDVVDFPACCLLTSSSQFFTFWFWPGIVLCPGPYVFLFVLCCPCVYVCVFDRLCFGAVRCMC